MVLLRKLSSVENAVESSTDPPTSDHISKPCIERTCLNANGQVASSKMNGLTGIRVGLLLPGAWRNLKACQGSGSILKLALHIRKPSLWLPACAQLKR